MNDLKHFTIVFCNTIVGISLMYAAFKTGSPIFYIGFIGWGILTYIIGSQLSEEL